MVVDDVDNRVPRQNLFHGAMSMDVKRSDCIGSIAPFYSKNTF
jgi:hypothetical protein